jgi:membrane fusion protein, multidrug efflux system
LIMLTIVGVLLGGIFGFKLFGTIMFNRYMANMKAPVVTVSSTKVGYDWWQPQLSASSGLRAVQGIQVTTEIAGIVRTIYFQPGALVKAGDLLVQLNADSDIAQLNALTASAELAKTVYQRDKAQYRVHAISKATLDADAANVKNTQALADQQAAIVAKKTIRAAFAGRLGISEINLGQFLAPGASIVPLQEVDFVYADFFVPQQSLGELKVGQPVKMTVEGLPGKTFAGVLTTINPVLDLSTRNVEVEATIPNPNYALVPGMFASITVDTGAPKRYLTLPQTAVTFNPFGDIVYVISQKTGKNEKDKPVLTVMQRFVTTGDTRGDQVVILKGLKEGESVVTSGQLKLKNGSEVSINNKVLPANNPAPTVVDE